MLDPKLRPEENDTVTVIKQLHILNCILWLLYVSHVAPLVTVYRKGGRTCIVLCNSIILC